MLTSRIEININFSMRGSNHAVGFETRRPKPDIFGLNSTEKIFMMKEDVKLGDKHLVVRLSLRNVWNGTIIGIEQPLKR
jgi:hypothetical protein